MNPFSSSTGAAVFFQVTCRAGMIWPREVLPGLSLPFHGTKQPFAIGPKTSTSLRIELAAMPKTTNLTCPSLRCVTAATEAQHFANGVSIIVWHLCVALKHQHILLSGHTRDDQRATRGLQGDCRCGALDLDRRSQRQFCRQSQKA